MAYYDEYLRGSSQLRQPEDSYLYSSSSQMAPSQNSYMSASQAQPQGVDAGSMASAGAQGAAMGGPAGAAMAVGGSFLSQYMAQKAADERQKRQMDLQIQQDYGQNQNKGFQTMMETYRGALR